MSTRKRPRRTKPAAEVITIKKKKKDDHNDSPYLERVRIYRRHKAISGCKNVDDQYETLDEISTGAYGFVFRARDKKTGEIVAIKRELDGLNETSLREIEILKSLVRHPSIVEFKKVAVDDDEGVYVVMEYLNNDLRRYIYSPKSSKPFNRTEVKYLMKQLLEGVKFLHDNGVMHRDLKPENILMRKLNRYPKLKICDFGLSRHYESGLGSTYTPSVVTLWYRAPEVLLGLESYSSKIDMWSVGCIMAELLLKKALFRGETEFGQLKEIYGILGTPNENVWPGFNRLPGSKSKIITDQPYNRLRDKVPAGVLTEVGFDLLNKLLAYDPAKRISAEDALNHDWFTKRKNKL